MEGEGGDVAGRVVAVAVVGESVGAVGEAVCGVLRGGKRWRWDCGSGKGEGEVGGRVAEGAAGVVVCCALGGES